MIIEYTNEELRNIEKIRDKYKEQLLRAKDPKDRAVIQLQLSESLNTYSEACQRERFQRIANDPEAVFMDAVNQIHKIIELEYSELTSHATVDDIKKLGIGSVSGDKIYLNAKLAGELVVSELKMHIDALRSHVDKSNRLWDAIVDGIASSDLTDNTEINIDPAAGTATDIKLYRRSPLSDILTFGILNDKTSARIIQDPDIFQTNPNGQMQLLWNVNQASPKKKEQVPVLMALTYDGNDAKITKKLSAFDMAVYTAVSNIYYYWKTDNPQKPLFITPQEIWRRMNGKQNRDGSAKPGASQIRRICRSMDKMRHIDFLMDISDEIKANYITLEDERLVGGRFCDYLLNATQVTFYTEQGRKVSGYRINAEPIGFTYNAAKDHVLFLPFELLDTSSAVSDSENVTEFKMYLLHQILLMKNGIRSRRILLETLYKATGISPPENRVEGREFATDASRSAVIRRLRKSDRDKIEGLLDAWKSKDWIKGYRALNSSGKPVGERQTVASYDIII